MRIRRALFLSSVVLALPALVQAGGDRWHRSGPQVSWSIGVGSGHHWAYRPYHPSPFIGWSVYDHPRGHWGHGYPGWRHDRWHDRHWGSSWGIGMSLPLIRNRDPWTERAVPRAVVETPAPPSAAERALSAFDSAEAQIPDPAEAEDSENAEAPDGAALAGRGLAALAGQDYVAAARQLREAFANDPASALQVAEGRAFRERCEALKAQLLHEHPAGLSIADIQFLRAVLFLYTGDRPSAAYAAASIYDQEPSTQRLQSLLGA